jgi:hypothetical protein
VAQSGFPDFRAEALRRGACTFLVKPVSMPILLNALRAALERHPVAPRVLAENTADVERSRRVALEKTRDAVTRLDARGMEEQRRGLQRITTWLQTYFGFGTSLANILRGRDFCIEAVHGALAAKFEEGARYPRENFYCDDVLAAGSTLLLTDPLHHPSAPFSHHPALAFGVRFYAGVPLTAPSGAVLGTLCIVDARAHDFRGEDMRVLEALGLGAARGLETRAWPLDEDGAFRREYLELFLDVAATRAALAGGAATGWTIEPGDPRALAQRTTGLAVVKLDGRLAVLWSGPADGWAPPEAIVQRAVASVEVRTVRDRDAVRRQLHAIWA